jgi:nitrogenase molybdenum-iron protein alpha/beta subunit/predicted Fe-Mo cluster-binding NifX family protein
MTKNLVNLNVNPCKMCMPMGSATAMYGIRGSMTILHGSQGCSTYIRRHMATHYNEPVDIASSSLTEQGTVMGGEKNLKKGLDNMIRIYDPEVIGVATTCLAETIGEDVPRILDEYKKEHPDNNVELIPISSAGYSGTQFEGYFKALYSVVERTQRRSHPNDIVNVVAGPMSPADIRWLKRLLSGSGIRYILLPDISDNLDGGHEKRYSRLPMKGTSIEDIGKMCDSKITIEISSFVTDELSPAAYLKERYGVPFIRLNLPVGLRDNDLLIEAIKSIGGKIDPAIKEERSRYLDAMVDSHKHNSIGRAAVFGEPDFVYSVVRMMTENGVMPAVVATGACSKPFKDAIIAEIGERSSECDILDDTDFDVVEKSIVEKNVNIMMGSSEARRIEDRNKIPLIRCAFPIHDHTGGQRVRMSGYEGGLIFMDRITNKLIDSVETTFRDDLKERYYDNHLEDPYSKDLKIDDIKIKSHAGYLSGVKSNDIEDVLIIAVSSRSGVLVDQHFGQSDDFYIYEYNRFKGIRFREHRSVSKSADGSVCCGGPGSNSKGDGSNKIEKIIGVLGDCNIIISMRIGEAPQRRLSELGIVSMMITGTIEEAVEIAVREKIREE